MRACANSFNKLVATLVEVLAINSEINVFIEMLTSHLELDVLSNETFDLLIKNMNSVAGAILIEKNGEIIVEAIRTIKNPELLVINNRVKEAFKNNERQILEFPTDILIDGVLVDSKPKEILIEPIAYKKVLLGVIILANTESFSKNSIDKLTVFSHSLSLAFRNAITHNQMKNLASIDHLTSLYNRRFGIMRLQGEFARAIRNGPPVSLLLFDIDILKRLMMYMVI